MELGKNGILRHLVFFFFGLFVWEAGYSQTQETQVKRIKEEMQFLSSDALSGRLPGTEGEEKAAAYILSQLKAIGCKSLCEEGYQDFTKELKVKNTTDEFYILKGRNVVGSIKGKKNPDNYIVIGAHYDHLGMGGVGSGSRTPDTSAVHNGADDNASGVSAMLECARWFSENIPDCSILFVAFSAEEKGLIGSKYFIDHPPVPKKKIKAMINFDMVGRLDSVLTLQGTGTALEFDTLITQVYQDEPFQIKRIPGGFGPSDQTSFYAEEIPVLYFHTSVHEQYHTPFDDWELINMNGIAQISGFASRLITRISEISSSLTYQRIGAKSEISHKGVKAALGIMPDHASINGLKVNAVRAGQAADRGGMLKGDVILYIQGQKVMDIESYMDIMSAYEKGDILIIDLLRNEEKLILTITL